MRSSACVLLLVLLAASAPLAQSGPPAWRNAAWTTEGGWTVRTTVLGTPTRDDPEAAQRMLRVSVPDACRAWTPGTAIGASEDASKTPGVPVPQSYAASADTLGRGCVVFSSAFADRSYVYAVHRTRDGRIVQSQEIVRQSAPYGRATFLASAEGAYVMLEGLEADRLVGLAADGRSGFDRSGAYHLPIAAAPRGDFYATVDVPRVWPAPRQTTWPRQPDQSVARVSLSGQDVWRRTLPRVAYVRAMSADPSGLVVAGAGEPDSLALPSATGPIATGPAATGRLVALNPDGVIRWSLDIAEHVEALRPSPGGLYTAGRSGDLSLTPRGAVDVWIRHVTTDGTLERTSRGSFPAGLGVEVVAVTRDGDDLVVTVAFGGLAGSESPADFLGSGALLVEFAVRAVPSDVGPGGAAAPPPGELTVEVRPNPGRAGGPVRVAVGVPDPGDVRVEVFDVRGRLVLESAYPAQGAGELLVELPSAQLAAGAYIVRVDVGRGRSWSVARLTVVR